jgi:hypothetical protein
MVASLLGAEVDKVLQRGLTTRLLRGGSFLFQLTAPAQLLAERTVITLTLDFHCLEQRCRSHDAHAVVARKRAKHAAIDY